MRLAIFISIAFAAMHAQPVPKEQGTFVIHLIQHAIGEERFDLKAGSSGELVLETTFESADRGNKRSIHGTLRMGRDFTPVALELKGQPNTSTTISGQSAEVQEEEAKRNLTLPPKFFVGSGSAPFAVQAMTMRYWLEHGKPARLPILRAKSGADDVRIESVGSDSLTIGDAAVTFTRYTVSNLVFGSEVLWLNAQHQLAAVMIFGGGLPMEAIRAEYEPAFEQLFSSGVTQQLKILAAIQRDVSLRQSGSFAITGATLVDGTGRPPIPDAVVIIRNGRIAAAGPRIQVSIPKGTPVVNAKGQTILPGLWEMHTHYSGVEFGPALLAAGVTTARDCGGEFEFLVRTRDAIAKQNALGPRLLLAGLVDASGPTGFGSMFADTPDQAREVVAKYHNAAFEQIKLYTFLKPDVISALSAEAHRLGMTVTGHVPAALNAFQGVEAGMDQINHLNYVSQMMRNPADRTAPIDFSSDQARKAIQFFLDHHTVVDDTASWGEMAGHSKDIDVTSFEPGVANAPFTLASKFISMGSANDAGRFHARMSETVAVIAALHRAGVTIVPGSDTGLVGYGLVRELELYVQAGMTPMEAIQSATIVSARAMKLDGDTGSIEPGKRADLILVDGDPTQHIADIRRVVRVVTNGRMYDSGDLWRSVGFHP